jgi:hypothetical protein
MMNQAREKRETRKEERSAGGKLKDKLLGSTKDEREQKRREKARMRARAEEEERVRLDSLLVRLGGIMRYFGC